MIPKIKEINNDESKKFIVNKNTVIIAKNDKYEEIFSYYADKILELENLTENKIIIHENELNFADEDYKIVNLGAELHIYGNFNGIIWAISTILQMAKSNRNLLKFGTIYDKPKFNYRGQMVDVVRHFYGVETIKKVIDMMFFAKLNKLHMHLSDDQGFRLDIEKYPKLKDIASHREKTKKDKVAIDGYFTKNDIKELENYAFLRGIEIIPEIDVPAHCTAILAAYPEYMCSPKSLKVATNYGIKPNILCAGNEKVYDFLEDIFSEIAKMFKSKYIHIGGDEALKIQWEKCDKCQKALEANELHKLEQLQGYFVNRVVKMLKMLGKTPIVWNEALNNGMLDKDCICQFWENKSYNQMLDKAINEDRKIIVSKVSNYYLDYPHKLVPLQKTYNFDCTLNNKSDNIIGVETPIWTEHIRSEKHFFENMLPRAIAVAENGWIEQSEKDYNNFKKSLIEFNKILDDLNINYSSVKESEAKGFTGFGKLLKFVSNFFNMGFVKTIIDVLKNKIKNR